jgi:hypothetical protein
LFNPELEHHSERTSSADHNDDLRSKSYNQDFIKANAHEVFLTNSATQDPEYINSMNFRNVKRLKYLRKMQENVKNIIEQKMIALAIKQQ